MTVSVVLADANILFSRTLRDYFLYLADEGAIELHWSQPILDEMSRNLRGRLGLGERDTTRLETLMNDFIEYALIDVASDDVNTVASIEMDPEDRHVLAAALSAEANVLLTNNTKHFPQQWMSEHGIELLGANRLLVRVATGFPQEARVAHERTVLSSPKSEEEILSTLERSAGPEAAAAVRRIARLS